MSKAGQRDSTPRQPRPAGSKIRDRAAEHSLGIKHPDGVITKTFRENEKERARVAKKLAAQREKVITN